MLDSFAIKNILASYLAFFPAEAERLAVFNDYLNHTAGDLYDRKNFDGHIVASAIVLDPAKTKFLAIYHPVFQRHQQPGGHIDPGENPLEAAHRETFEESGYDNLLYLPFQENKLIPVEIIAHRVSANPHKNEDAHWHFDFRYVFVAPSEDIPMHREIQDTKWILLDDVEKIDGLHGIPAKIKKFFVSYTEPLWKS